MGSPGSIWFWTPSRPAISSALIALTVGLTVGLTAAFYGGRIDAFLMRIVDIQLSFPVQITRFLYGYDSFPHFPAYVERIVARPAYQRAIERGGPYAYGS